MTDKMDRETILSTLHKRGIKPIFDEYGIVDHFEASRNLMIGIKSWGLIGYIGAHVIRV